MLFQSKSVFHVKTLKFLIIISIFTSLASCHSTKLPLCPKLSTTNPSPVTGISKTLYDICNKRNIKVTVLSSTVAEFNGPRRQLKWLVSNYSIILCDFNQQTVVNDKAYYDGCMTNSINWIKIVQGNRLDTLMLNSTNYCINCCE
jgi:hypothetical protein